MSDQNKGAKKLSKALKKRHEFTDVAEEGEEAEAGPSKSVRINPHGAPYLKLRTLSAATRDLERETVAASRDMLHDATIKLEAEREAEDLQQISQLIRESPSDESGGEEAGGSADEENRLAMLELAYARYCVQKRILRDNPEANVRHQKLDEYEVLDKLKDLSASSVAIELQTQTAEGDPPLDFSGESFANIIEVVRQSVECGDLEGKSQPANRSQASSDGFNYQGYLDAINDQSIPPSPKNSTARLLTGPFSYVQLQNVLEMEEKDVGLAIDISSKYLRDKKSKTKTPCGTPEKPCEYRPGSPKQKKKSQVALNPTDLVEPLPELVAEMLELEEQGTPLTSSPNEIFTRLFPGGITAAVAQTKRSKTKSGVKNEESEDDSKSKASQTEIATEEASVKKGSDLDMSDLEDQPGNDDKDLPPKYQTLISLRSTVLPKWFPGYLIALPETNGVQRASCPSDVLSTAYLAARHSNFHETSNIIIGD